MKRLVMVCCGVLVFVFCGAWQAAVAERSGGFAIVRPVKWQVVQRNAENRGMIRVHVRDVGNASAVDARVVLMPGASGRETAWRSLRQTGERGVYTGAVDAVAGGWYVLHVRAVRGGVVFAKASVEKVGVGEVFVTAGQSNSSNYGGTRLRAKQDRVVAYGNGTWQPAADPMPGARGEGGSPWCPFGDLLVKYLNMPVAVAAVGYHGVKAEGWAPGGEAFPRMKKVLKALGPGGARAVLWHQGEADNTPETTEESYYATMKKVIDGSRAAAGYKIPWMVARASFCPARYNPPSELCQAVRAAQTRLWKEGIALQGPDTDDMTGRTYRCSDDIHMNEHGLVVHGTRWFEQVKKELFKAEGKWFR